MFHISDIQKFERCNKLFWLHQNQPLTFLPYIYFNENIVSLSMQRLSITDYFEGKVGDDGMLAMDALLNYDTLINARFVYHNLRIKCPIMRKSEDGWDIYFTYASCWPKEHYAVSISDTCWVLNHLGIKIHNIYAIHLNALYVREDELDVDKLLIISSYLYNNKNKANHRIDDLVKKNSRDVDPVLKSMETILLKKEVKSKRCNACTRGNKCSYFDICFEPVSNTSILNLVQSAHKGEMKKQGINEIIDTDVNLIEGTRHQYAQIMAARNHGMFFDYFAMKAWIDEHIHEPISYLDFEWETYAYPPYKGMKPFDVLVFQYSLHVEVENQELQHYEYLGVKDCREDFILHLLHDIPKQGTILVFNMEGAEKLRLIQLSIQFPQYAKELKKVWDRMVDLSLPFSSGNLYDERMAGLYSLKKLVSVFSDYRYSDLDISYGMDAVRNWRLLDNLDCEESKIIKKHLFEYCSMDTYSEYIVYHAILDILNKTTVSI
ncbi:MAG: DUF2779 domain-containing protein [Erysipelotrichaceae bacterium]